MTAICGGGPSGPLPSASGTIDLHVSAIAAFIVPFVGDFAAALLAPIIIAGADIVAPTFCATDPPADPGLTAAIIADAIALPPTLTTFDSDRKVLDWFLHQYWFQICHCTTVTTPAAPAPSNPGSVNINPGLPKGNSVPCWDKTVSWSVAPVFGGIEGVTDMHVAILPNGQPIVVMWPNTLPASPGQVLAVPIDPGITAMNLDVTVNEAITTTGITVTIGTASWNADGSQFTPIGGTGPALQFNSLGPLTKNSFLAAMANTTAPRFWSFTVQNQDTITHTGTAHLSFTCPPGINYGQCCVATDPLLEGELQTILQYVQAIYSAIPVPVTSFAEATVHSGLSGNGSFSIASDAIALKVALTTIPSWVGFNVGSPDFYFDVGFIAFTTSEGSYASQRITYQDQVLTVPLLGLTVDYTFENGVVASVTELTRGP